jgi:catechol 2,3-dioxygenase-like lactoylglutathione lyase family enzyme
VARIATHCTEADVSLQHFAAAREMGMETVGFLMLAHRIGPEELAKQARIMVDGGAQCVYVVDSAGALVLGDAQARVAFYTEVLGCELRTDIEVWPGARLVEVVPPGSSVGLVLLPPDSEIPMAVRLGTTNAETAYARLRQAGAKLHNDEVLHLDGAPPMFFFADPDGNGLVYLEEEPGGASDN